MLKASAATLLCATLAAGGPLTFARLSPHMQLLNVDVGGTSFPEAIRLLDPEDDTQSPNEAPTMPKPGFTCFLGADGTVLLITSDGSIVGGTTDRQGGVAVTEYRLYARMNLADFTPYAPESAKGRPRCLPGQRVTHETGTDGGLKLGMTEKEVRALLGAPTKTRKGFVEYEAAETDDGERTVRQLSVAFELGKAVGISAKETGTP